MFFINHRLRFVGFAFCALLVACSKPPQALDITKSVLSVSPQSRVENSLRVMSGVIQAADETNLSFEVAGVVKQVNVAMGESFAQGDVLATLVATEYELVLAQREGQISELESRLVEAQADLARKTQLRSEGAVSQALLDSAQTLVATLQEQLKVVKAQRKQALKHVNDTQLKAPFSGQIATRAVEPAQQVAVGTPVFTVLQPQLLEVALYVPESLINQLSVGQNVDIVLTAQQNPSAWQGKVFEIAGQARHANAFPVTISLPAAAASQARAGMSVEVYLPVNARQAKADEFSLPLSAVGADKGNQHFVYRLQSIEGIADHKVEKVTVELMELADGRAYVRGNLHTSDLLVRNGLSFLHPEQIVHVADGFPRTINE